MKTLIALARCAHAVPTAAVTTFAVLVAAEAGAAYVAVGFVVLCGQLSIGWSNDYVDRERDRAGGRDDKPLVRRAVRDGVVGAAAGIALALSVGAGFTIGVAAGAANVVAVTAGWAYNLGLKSTVLSPLGYVVHFGIVPPLLATLARPEPQVAPARLVAASALLGVSAHFANVIPDVRVDCQTGVLGLPQRLGATRSAVGSAMLLLGASALLVGVPDSRTEAALGVVAVIVAVAYGVAVARPRGLRDRRAFALNIAANAVVVTTFVAASDVLTASR